MTIYQLRAHFPGLGEINLLEPPRLTPTTDSGLPHSPSGAGGLLVPFANRLRGKPSADGLSIETEILGRKVKLPTNWGPADGERLAIHGFLLSSPFPDVSTESSNELATVTGRLNAGNFGGLWFSECRITVHAALSASEFALTVTAKNTGEESLPVGIGWHPNFHYPSGKRDQVRLRVPAALRAEINNYEECFPSGKLLPVQGSAYDFSATAPIGDLFLDDCFTALNRDADGQSIAELIDPAANLRLRVHALSPEIQAFQVFAPVQKPFVAIEPQFNLADPFSSVWGGRDTGMVLLAPGQSVDYRVVVELQALS